MDTIMKKMINFSCKKIPHCLVLIPFIFLIFFLGCGGDGGSDSSSGSTSGSSPETGSIAINFKILEASINHSPKIASKESKLLRLSKLIITPKSAMAAIDCVATGVAEIVAKVYDASDIYLVSGGPWPCSAHSGTIDNVPVGTNRKVLILAQDSNGEVLHWGEAKGLTVLAGVTTDAGTIVANDISMSVNDILSNGFNNLKDGTDGEAFKAETYFQGAMIKTEDVTSNDADTALFFYALTRIGVLAYQIQSDGVDDGLKDIGDILDAFGYSQTESRLPLRGLRLQDPDLLPFDSPRGADLQDFLYNVLRPELEGAIANLANVSTSFNRTWVEPDIYETVESDYGDVLFFRSIFKGVLAYINIMKAYNLDADIDQAHNDAYTVEDFLAYESNFLTLSYAYSRYLNAAKSHFESGLNDLYDAIIWMEQETDNQDNDYVNLTSSTTTEIQQAKLDIVDAKNSLMGPAFVHDNEDLAKGFTLDMSIFFAGLNLRNFLPPITGDGASGLFPDPTFAGIVGPEENLNEDIDPQDGIPDGLPENIPPVLLKEYCIPTDGSTYNVNSTHTIELLFNERMGFEYSYNSNFGVGHDSYWSADRRIFIIQLWDNLISGATYTITLNPSTYPIGFQDEWDNLLPTDTIYSFTQE